MANNQPVPTHFYDKEHEPIVVTARFVQGKRPEIISFVWKEKEYQVVETTLIVKARHGREAVWLITVATENAAFKLRLDTDTLNWWLVEYSWGE